MSNKFSPCRFLQQVAIKCNPCKCSKQWSTHCRLRRCKLGQAMASCSRWPEYNNEQNDASKCVTKLTSITPDSLLKWPRSKLGLRITALYISLLPFVEWINKISRSSSPNNPHLLGFTNGSVCDWPNRNWKSGGAGKRSIGTVKPLKTSRQPAWDSQ